MFEIIIIGSIVAAALLWLIVRIHRGTRPEEGTRCEGCSSCSCDGRLRSTGAACVVLAAVAFAPKAHAIDTVEPFAVGATDFEVYAGASGLGLTAEETEIGAIFQLGYGLTERLSGYVNGGAAANGHLADGAGALGFGVYGTPADTELFDLDLFLDFGIGGAGFSEFGAGVGTEINLDIRAFGLFLGAFEVFGGRETTREDEPEGSDRTFEATFDTELAIGARVHPAEGHELLLLYDLALHHVPVARAEVHEVGGIALGYNVMILDNLELINEVRCDIPQAGEGVSFSFLTGILATTP